jgi:hypothetical protein
MDGTVVFIVPGGVREGMVVPILDGSTGDSGEAGKHEHDEQSTHVSRVP